MLSILSQSQQSIKYSKKPHNSGKHYQPILHISQQQHETVTENAPTGKSTPEMVKLFRYVSTDPLETTKKTLLCTNTTAFSPFRFYFFTYDYIITAYNLKPKKKMSIDCSLNQCQANEQQKKLKPQGQQRGWGGDER